jgi:hypothetical protein
MQSYTKAHMQSYTKKKNHTHAELYKRHTKTHMHTLIEKVFYYFLV